MVTKRYRAIRGATKQNSGASGPQVIEQHLSKILLSIAHLLLRNGYGYSRVNKLTKVAFVNAARSIDTGSKPRISIARIAAVTGLTRVEVSQLLRSNERYKSTSVEPLNRAARVIDGWMTDEKYCDERSQPQRLPYAAARTSFSGLVRKYSGDIPARAMLAEMKRLGMVRHLPDDTIEICKSKRAGSRVALTAMRAITPWVHFLSDLDKLGQQAELTSSARNVRLQFDSVPQVFAAAREIENRRTLFVESLRQIGGRADKRSKHQLDISIAVAIAASTPTRKSQHKKG